MRFVFFKMQSEFLTIKSVVEVFPNRRGRAYA